MFIILKIENLWGIVETKKSITSFHLIIMDRLYIETQLVEAKQRTQLRLTMLVANSLIEKNVPTQ